MHADLVRASGFELGLEQRDRRIGAAATPSTRRKIVRASRPSLSDPDAPLAVAGHVGRERQFDRAHRVAPLAADQHGVALVDRAVAQLRVQAGQREALLGDEQNARRFAVEPMHELEECRVRTRETQPLDDAERDAAAAVNGETRRLVERDQRVVLEQDRGDRDRARRWHPRAFAPAPTPGSAEFAAGRRR